MVHEKPVMWEDVESYIIITFFFLPYILGGLGRNPSWIKKRSKCMVSLYWCFVRLIFLRYSQIILPWCPPVSSKPKCLNNKSSLSPVLREYISSTWKINWEPFSFLLCFFSCLKVFSLTIWHFAPPFHSHHCHSSVHPHTRAFHQHTLIPHILGIRHSGQTQAHKGGQAYRGPERKGECMEGEYSTVREVLSSGIWGPREGMTRPGWSGHIQRGGTAELGIAGWV